MSVFWRGLKKVLMSAIAVAVILPVPMVSATGSDLTLEREPTNYWLASSDLIISAYQRDVTGQDIQLVEAYNDGKAPIDILDWTITGVFRKGEATLLAQMDIRPRAGSGLLEPGEHVVIDAADLVTGASYEMEAWSVSKPDGQLIKLITEKQDVTTHEYELKSTSIKNEGVTKIIYDELWRRNPTTVGYSFASTPFTTGSTSVYDNGLYKAPVVPAVQIVEIYPYASSCDPFDLGVLCRDYVKLYNPTSEDVDLADYTLRTDSSSTNRTSSNTISLDGIVIPAHGYYPISQTDDGSALSLTNSGGHVWLEDLWGLVRYPDTLALYESAGTSRQGHAWTQTDSGTWQWSSTPQPIGPNMVKVEAVVADLAECPTGKYRNPETNRCRTIEEAVNALATCPEGQSRNLTTNRCRSDETQKSSSPTPCKEGQERNPATNRCRSIASAVAELLPCDEGQERNPTTNRCRKIQNIDMPLAGFPVDPVKPSTQSTVMWWVVAGVMTLLAGYGAWEWRSELGLATRKLAVVTRLRK